MNFAWIFDLHRMKKDIKNIWTELFAISQSQAHISFLACLLAHECALISILN